MDAIIKPHRKELFPMAKFLSLTVQTKITDGGVTVVDRSFAVADREIEEKIEATIRIPSGGSKFIAVEGTDITGKTDPMVLGLSQIRGFALESDVQVEFKIDGAAAGVPFGPGAVAMDNATISTLEIENANGLPANIKLIVWGDR
jgi:hypothetical protein